MFILFALAFFSRDGYCELSEIGEGCDPSTAGLPNSGGSGVVKIVYKSAS